MEQLNKFEKFSLVCYIAMGWSIVLIPKPAWQNLNSFQLKWLILGGVFYTVGAIFYVLGKKKKYIHSIWHIFVLIGGATEDTGFQSTTHVIRGVIWGVIWFLYLSFSDQVQEVIPQSFRKITSTDWAMLAASVLLPVFLFVVGYSLINSLVDSRTTQETELRKAELAYNQRTDGRVIFTIPDGFECESQVVDVEGTSATLFSINKKWSRNTT